VTLEVVTDGTISPEEAFKKSVAILVDQFTALSDMKNADDEAEEAEALKEVAEEAAPEAESEKE
jgi:DNA-directed RNA polymerase alpha subunit